jgi:4-alpha-glucanotransferase
LVSVARRQLGRLAALYGIERSYQDIWRRRHVVPIATQRAQLAAMGVPAANPAQVEESLARAEEAAWCAPLPPVIVTRKPGPCATLTLPAATSGRIACTVVTECGETVQGESDLDALETVASGRFEGTDFRRYRLVLPDDLPAGYHRLVLAAGDAGTSLIVAPQRAYAVDGRLWGVTAPLYGVRSATNWGMGDLADLGRLAAACGRRGAAFLGINPIHAQLPAAPAHYSPYSPSSRRFLNVLLIAVEKVPELNHCAEALTLLASPAHQARLRAVRAAAMIDYPAVAALKLEVLALLFASLAHRPARLAAFEVFRREGGERVSSARRCSTPCSSIFWRRIRRVPHGGRGPRPIRTRPAPRSQALPTGIASGWGSSPTCNGSPTSSSRGRRTWRPPT